MELIVFSCIVSAGLKNAETIPCVSSAAYLLPSPPFVVILGELMHAEEVHVFAQLQPAEEG